MKWLLLLLAGAGGCRPSALPAPAKVAQVAISGMQFVPAVLEVKVGDSIEWKNEDLVPHSATSDHFDSKVIEAGGSWKWVADKSGDVDYHCMFHPTMKARLSVH